LKLKAQLCAVKIPIHRTEDKCAKEVHAMKRIQGLGDGPTSRFVQLLDHAEMKQTSYSPEGSAINECRWFFMKAIQGFNLLQFRRPFSKDVVPEVLVWHIYLQLSEALQYLHSLDPPLVHRDLSSQNIMLDVSHRGVSSLPNVVVVDFGNAQNATEPHMAYEYGIFYHVLRSLASLSYSCYHSRKNDARSDKVCAHDED
jgi:serine/threonine protein kinase